MCVGVGVVGVCDISAQCFKLTARRCENNLVEANI